MSGKDTTDTEEKVKAAERTSGKKSPCFCCRSSENNTDYDGISVFGNVLRDLYEGIRLFLCISSLHESCDFRRLFGVCGGNDVAGGVCTVTDLFGGAYDTGKAFVLRHCPA